MPLIIALVTGVTGVTGCTADTEQTEATNFRVIENGTTVMEVRENASYADFYIPEGMQTPFESDRLDDKLKKVYDDARADLGYFRETTLLPVGLDAIEYSRILDIIRYEELSYFPLKGRGIGDYLAAESTFQVLFEYYLDGESAAETMTRLNSEIEDAAAEVMTGIAGLKDDYSKIKYIHDWMILNIQTDSADSTDIYSSTLYGAMVNKKALCEGMAKAFSYLCNLAGVENCIVVGMAKLPHMWNMVKLSGNWYHVDVTYDHPDEEITAVHPGFISYQYFCVPDEVIANDHTLSVHAFTPPAANATIAGYFNHEGYIIGNEAEAEKVIAKALVDAAEAGRSFASVKCSSTDLYMRVADRISERGGFDGISDAVMEQTGIKQSYSVSDYYSKFRILTFFAEGENP
jgi:hypothetical protein